MAIASQLLCSNRHAYVSGSYSNIDRIIIIIMCIHERSADTSLAAKIH